MADTANQIIQTLEGIANDISNAKSTLTQNNVVLDSSTTKTLATEIGKLPAAIKASPVLERFNNGTLTMKNGFIYSSDVTFKLDSTNCVPVNAREYVIPRGMIFSMKFPGYLADLKSYIGEQLPDNSMRFFNIFKIYTDNQDITELLFNLNAAYIDNILENKKSARPYGLKIVLSSEFYKPDENGYYTFDRLLFPCYNSEFYVRQPDGSEVKITKFKCKTFYFTLTYQQKTVDIICDSLNVSVFNLQSMIDKKKQRSSMPNNFNRNLNNKDCYIINMPKVNITYYPFAYATTNPPFLRLAPIEYTKLGSTAYLQPADNIQIRVNETQENIEKLKSDVVKFNIFPFLKIFNADGTKVFNPVDGTFNSNITAKIPGLDIPIDNKNAYIDKYSNNLGVYDADAKQYISYKTMALKSRTDRQSCFNSIKVVKTPGYDDYMYSTNSDDVIDNISFGSNIPDVFENFPLMQCLDYVLAPNNSEFSGTDLNCSKRIKFKFSENLLDKGYTTPLAGFTKGDSGPKFNGISLYCDNWGGDPLTELSYSDGKYIIMNDSARLLISPFDTEFYAKDGTLIDKIFAYKAPIMYNKNIKTVRVQSQYDMETQALEKNGVIYPLISLNFTYPYAYPRGYDDEDEPITPGDPAAPMKYIIDKDTIIKQYPGKYCTGKFSGQTPVFDADSDFTRFEKYIRILCPENHTKLGTYEFDKFRLPLYNLDESKKYNYSNKTWEPVGATTLDTVRTRNLYQDEVLFDSLRSS